MAALAIGDPASDVGEPTLGIDIIDLRRRDEGLHRGGSITIATGLGQSLLCKNDSDARARRYISVMNYSG